VVRERRLEQKLHLIARAVVEAELFRRAVVQLYGWTFGEKVFGSAGISADEQEWLLTHDVIDPALYARVVRYAVALGGPVYFVPHEVLQRVLPDADDFLLRGESRPVGPGFWHPEDMLYCQLQSSDGIEMGNITADEPFDGRVPSTRTAELLAPFVALASAVLEQELGRRRDALTGCFNGACCRDEIGRRLRDGRRFALAFVDMDRLKHVNDHEGHAAGDREIQRVAGLLRQAAAPFDGSVSRLHGDEFVVMFWSDNDEGAIRERLEHEWRLSGADASFGVTLSRPDDDTETLLRRAELLMYEDKVHRRSMAGTLGSDRN
jgi:diguanylate cyclase (GGDEF)-like protein